MKKIAQIILAVAIVALVYVIYDQISTPIKFDDELKAKKAQVIDRIKDIRTAQRAFKSKYQRFTGSFDTLTNFILQDTLELERKIVDEDDSVAMAQLKKMGKKNVEKFKIAVIDTIFSPKRLSKQDVEQLRYIPGTDDKAQYIMEAGIITTESKVVIPIVECRAPYKMFLDTVAYRQEIINLIDDEVNNFNRYPGVKFGSMEQVTGSNTPQATNKVSIQLTLDGHSFSAHGLDGEFPGEEPVEAELLTARTMLVPEEVLGTGDAGTLLAANGMAPAAEERAVCSLPVQGIVAVMAAHREALRQVEEKLGDRIRYTTPLLREVQAGTPTVWAYRTAGLLYIKVYDGSLRFAGVIPAPDTADVCYFTERLEKEFALKSCELRISGDDAKACGKLLKGYFKRIVCE